MENNTENSPEVKTQRVAKPYHDLRTPFIVDHNGAIAEYIIQDPDEMPELALGANIIIKDRRDKKDYWIAGRIVGLKAISPFNPNRENLLYIEDEEADPSKVLEEVTGPHTHQPMVIRVLLDREMENMSDEKARTFVSYPIQRPPSAISRMFFPDILPDDTNPTKAPTLSDILEVRPKGVALGKIGFGNIPYHVGDKFLTYNWDIENLDNKHIFIVGESGSGKTVFLKNLAFEIRKLNKKNRVLLTDVQGDIIQLLLFDVAKTLEAKGWQTKVKTVSSEDARKILEKFRLIIPAKNGVMSPQLAALKKLAQNRGIDVKEIGLRIQDLSTPSDVEYLFRVASEQAGMLLDEEAEALIIKSQPVTIANLRSAINAIMSKNPTNNSLLSSGGTSYFISTFFAALRALKSLEQYFDFHQPSMQQVQNPLNDFNFDGTTILYLDELDNDERVMWEMQLVKWLYENKKNIGNTYVLFDEAHQIIPANPDGSGAKGTFERLRANFEKLAREGRKFGINLILSTQNPKDLHPIVPEQCPTRVVMKINPRNANYAFLDPELALIANRFGQGQFWIQSPFNGTPNWVRVHSIAPPLPHEPMVEFWSKVISKAKETGEA